MHAPRHTHMMPIRMHERIQEHTVDAIEKRMPVAAAKAGTVTRPLTSGSPISPSSFSDLLNLRNSSRICSTTACVVLPIAMIFSPAQTKGRHAPNRAPAMAIGSPMESTCEPPKADSPSSCFIAASTQKLDRTEAGAEKPRTIPLALCPAMHKAPATSWEQRAHQHDCCQQQHARTIRSLTHSALLLRHQQQHRHVFLTSESVPKSFLQVIPGRRLHRKIQQRR